MRALILLFVYSIPIFFLLYVLIDKRFRRHYIWVKTVSSAAFVAAAVYCAYVGNHMSFFISMLPGFLLCLCGDVVMGLYNRIQNRKFFLTGVFAFLAGHIFFVASFCLLQSLSVFDFVFPIIAIFITIQITKQRNMILGRLKPYAYVYSFFVALLFSKSIHLVIEVCSVQRILLAAGATLFMISDILILYLYFYKHRAWCIHGLNIATYYYGVFLLSISLLY